MPEIEFNDLAEKGVIRDEAAYQLPPEVWTTANNMRSSDGAMASMKGWSETFGTGHDAPAFALPVVNSSQAYWLWTSLGAAYVWDGSTHTNISRAVGGAYTAPDRRYWNGTLLGGIPILNSGTDVPQYWAAYSTAQLLQALTNWPATGRTKILRAFGAYLVAFNYTLAGTNYPHLVKWSQHVTGPGTLPASWDETDPAIDAGEYDLPDSNAGLIMEALPLGSKMFIYKEQSIWSMRFIGGSAIFSFDTYADNVGILSERCVAVTGDGKHHVFATQDDIMMHDGNNVPVSILHKKLRKAIFNDMDTTTFRSAFMFTDLENSEVLFCYPQKGAFYPTRALVYNYRTGALTEADCSYQYAVAGRVESSSDETWAAGSNAWDVDDGAWSTQDRRKVILLDAVNSKFYKYNDTYTRDGVTYRCTLQRTGLSIVGRKRTGEWIVNHEIMKFVDRMWPKVRGGPIQIRIGVQMTVNGPVTWGDYVTFDPSTQVVADLMLGEIVSGRAVAVEFSTPIANEWALDGYRLSIVADGQF